MLTFSVSNPRGFGGREWGVCVDGVDNRIFQLNFKAVSLEKLCMLCFFFFSF